VPKNNFVEKKTKKKKKKRKWKWRGRSSFVIKSRRKMFFFM